MYVYNIKYAHYNTDELIRAILLEDKNPLAVELAKRTEDYKQELLDEIDELEWQIYNE